MKFLSQILTTALLAWSSSAAANDVMLECEPELAPTYAPAADISSRKIYTVIAPKGSIQFNLVVQQNGSVSDVSIIDSSGYQLWDDTVRTVIAKWLYPARKSPCQKRLLFSWKLG